MNSRRVIDFPLSIIVYIGYLFGIALIFAIIYVNFNIQDWSDFYQYIILMTGIAMVLCGKMLIEKYFELKINWTTKT